VLDSVKPYTSSCYTVLVTYPDYEVVKEFLKRRGVDRHFFPTLTLDELKHMRDSCFGGKSEEGVDLTDEELERRYLDVFGGIPRFALSDKSTTESDSIIKEMVSKAASQLQSGRLEPEDFYQLSHRVFHLIVSRESFKIEKIAFASIKAAQLLDEFDKLAKHTAMNAFLSFAPGKPIFGALYGQAFEAMVRRELPLREKLETIAINGDEVRTVLLPNDASASPRIFGKASEICRKMDGKVRIWAPNSSTQPAFDFIITRDAEMCFLNATVSASHDIVLKTEKGTGLLDVVAILQSNGFRVDGNGGINFCWILPEQVFPGFPGFGSKKMKADDEKLMKNNIINEYKVVVAPSEK
jgi:hypothetical protein